MIRTCFFAWMLPARQWLKAAGILVFLTNISGTVFPQTLTVSCKGNDVTNKEVSVEGKASDDVLSVHLVITNTAKTAVQVKVRKVENSVVEGSQNSICLGVCYAPFVYVSLNAYTIPAGQSTGEDVFYAEYCPGGFPGKSVITYEVFDIYDAQNNKASVVVNFISSPGTGTGKTMMDMPAMMVYPNPSPGDWITLRFAGTGKSSKGKVIIMNSSGDQINSFFPNDYHGNFQIDASKYSSGFYYCLLIENGKQVYSEKFIINR